MPLDHYSQPHEEVWNPIGVPRRRPLRWRRQPGHLRPSKEAQAVPTHAADGGRIHHGHHQPHHQGVRPVSHAQHRQGHQAPGDEPVLPQIPQHKDQAQGGVNEIGCQ